MTSVLRIRRFMVPLLFGVFLFVMVCSRPFALVTDDVVLEETAVFQSKSTIKIPQDTTQQVKAPARSVIKYQSSKILSDSEMKRLGLLLEEEKLARDVYLTLYELWEFPPFHAVAGSEQNHMDIILILFNEYNLDNSAAMNEIGVFSDPEHQARYDWLVSMGSQSLEQALLVGGVLEEIDIIDFYEELTKPGSSDKKFVYRNLLVGSEQHLRTFVISYEAYTHDAYKPQYLNAIDFDNIMDESAGDNRVKPRNDRLESVS